MILGGEPKGVKPLEGVGGGCGFVHPFTPFTGTSSSDSTRLVSESIPTLFRQDTELIR